MSHASSSSFGGSTAQAIVLALLVIIAIPFVMMILMMPMMGAFDGGHMGGWMWDGTGASWAWVAMWLVMLGVLAIGGYLVYRVFRSPSTGTDSAMAELRTAYARGELSDEEFEQRRERLQRP